MARVENPEVFQGRYNREFGKTVLAIFTGDKVTLKPGEVYDVEVGSHGNAYIDGAFVGGVSDFDRIEVILDVLADEAEAERLRLEAETGKPHNIVCMDDGYHIWPSEESKPNA